MAHDAVPELRSVVAPAGCGKTHEIVRLVGAQRSKPALVLTHTNAGVAVLRSRLRREGTAGAAYRLSTLDAWTLMLVRAFPGLAGLSVCPPRPMPEFNALRQAGLRVLQSGAVDRAIRASYGVVLVDEYQDCSETQHAMILELSRCLSGCVFGDPMQAIFGFDEPLVSWAGVAAAFAPAPPLTTPWRWLNARAAPLGEWLLDSRGRLAAGEPVDLASAPGMHLLVHRVGSDARDAMIIPAVKTLPGERILLLGPSERPAARVALARQNRGWSVIERADLPELREFADDVAAATGAGPLLDHALKLASGVMTGVNAGAITKRIATIQGGRSRTETSGTEAVALRFMDSPSPASMRELLLVLRGQSGARLLRGELFWAILQVLAAAEAFDDVAARAAAQQERMRFSERRPPTRAVGSTLLLKGLEAAHAVVVDADRLTRNHLYVAMTRGSRSVTLMMRGTGLCPKP